MGTPVDRQRLLPGKTDCICCCGGDFLLRVLCLDFLAEEARIDAWTYILQRAD